MSVQLVDKSLARDRIVSTRRRLNDLRALGDQFGVRSQERHQLSQEFFFHAVGVIEMVAQLVNEGRALGMVPDMVSPRSVAAALAAADPIAPVLSRLYANLRRDPMPPNPYNDAGHIWRLWNYRHQVSHRGRNPFHFQLGAPPVMMLDPRNAASGNSTRPALDELQAMIDFVERECEAVLAQLP